ncbi:MAG: alpha amylase [Lachnospiraceae bacterium]|nr:alpha amylase [Lachnospiraceae bacterium]
MEKKMRSINRITALCMVICMLVGCGKMPASDAPAETDAPDSTVEATVSQAPAVELPVNIVDDNYRNYYEIFPASYCDSNGDGCGDLKGIESKLDYITDLGCNGIWLTPIMSAPSYHKYDTTDYYSVDPSFGTNDDFKSLADACHEKGVRLIIDLVINHSSSEHPWFKEACDYLRTLSSDEEPDLSVCPYVDYYHFSREKVNGTYCDVPGCDWYYEAVFYYTQPDLNLANEAVIEELKKVADFWIDLGCDGFRMDAAMHYDDASSSYNIEFLHDYYEYCLSRDPQFYMVSEVWAPEKTIAEYYASGTPSFFNFDAADAEGKLIKAGRGTLSAEKFAYACAEYQETFGAANPGFIDAPFITNHDMGRVANAVMSDPVALKMTAGLLLSMNGSPFIYYGEEIGMKSKGKPDENKRLHMNWSVTDMAGICNDPSGADKDIEQSFAPVDEQINDPDSLYSYYKEALAIRNAYPEIARGEISIADGPTDGNIAVITKTWEGESITIVYNNGEDTAEVDLSGVIASDAEVAGVLCAAGDDSDASGTGAAGSENGSDPKYGLHNTALMIPGKCIIYLK